MKAKIKYTDESLGKLRVVDDFLPTPEDLLINPGKCKNYYYPQQI